MSDSPIELLTILTPREVECLRLRCKGYTNKGVAKQIYLEPSTVRNHVARAFERTGIRNIAEFCYKLGECNQYLKASSKHVRDDV